ncbi:hypothetical protein CS006_05950 [Bifidobacterium primatium]|uniref:Aminoglycoside phosphotransferase domain-containing protein n=1 Tax=Bifidobacterium primatium TaxID=2045438 RepID=A0A2M9H9S7_9BIFI|nr:phosphotransferase [Bifidobacterium primatium]PJM73566.1 hypothetical protein CS006_05950 [Bifidobacterium primatium]
MQLLGFRALEAPYASIGEQYARDLLDREYDLGRATLRRIMTEKDDTFAVTPADADGPRYVLRIENICEDYAAVLLRAKALRLLETRSPLIPATRIIPSVDDGLVVRCDTADGTRWATLTTFLPGRVLSTIEPPYRTALVRDIGSKLGQLQQALTGLGSFDDRYGRILWDVRLLPVIADEAKDYLPNDAIRRLVANVVDDYRAVADDIADCDEAICHGDFHPGNVTVDPADPTHIAGILDFGDMHAQPQVCDLGTCLFYMVDTADIDDPFAQCRTVLDGFLRARPDFDRTQMRLLPQIIKARCALTVLIPALANRFAEHRADHYLSSVSDRIKELAMLQALPTERILAGLGVE